MYILDRDKTKICSAHRRVNYDQYTRCEKTKGRDKKIYSKRRGNRSPQSLRGEKRWRERVVAIHRAFLLARLTCGFLFGYLTHSSDDYAPRFTRNSFYARSSSAIPTFVITSRRDSLPATLSYKLPDRIYRAISPSNFPANVTTIIPF